MLIYCLVTQHIYPFLIIADCRQTISNCTDCRSDPVTDEALCSQCHEGYALSANNRSCGGRLNVKRSDLMFFEQLQFYQN